jgi:hypothetical protein
MDSISIEHRIAKLRTFPYNERWFNELCWYQCTLNTMMLLKLAVNAATRCIYTRTDRNSTTGQSSRYVKSCQWAIFFNVKIVMAWKDL